MALPQPSKRIESAEKFIGANFEIPLGRKLIQLSLNESWLTPPESWIEAVRHAVMRAAKYPDPECTSLRRAIAETLTLDEGRIVCSAGLMECLHTIALTFLDPSDDVIIPEHAFVYFRQICQVAGARVVLAPEKRLTVDVESITKLCTPSTKAVLLANPGNPTGTYVDRSTIVKLRSTLPTKTLLIIDEAYAEFVEDFRYKSLFDLTNLGNTLVLRSFSKMYGLAGFRVGWAYCPPEFVSLLRKMQVPSTLSAPAQEIATVAIRDQPTVQQHRRRMLSIRDNFYDRVSAIGELRPVKSETNFMLIQTRSDARAKELDSFLRLQGIVLGRPTAVSLGSYLRATIGNEAQMELLISKLQEWSMNSRRP